MITGDRASQLGGVDDERHMWQEPARRASSFTMCECESADLDQRIGASLPGTARLTDDLAMIVERIGHVEHSQRGFENGRVGRGELT